jgi:hypothetical protein
VRSLSSRVGGIHRCPSPRTVGGSAWRRRRRRLPPRAMQLKPHRRPPAAAASACSPRAAYPRPRRSRSIAPCSRRIGPALRLKTRRPSGAPPAAPPPCNRRLVRAPPPSLSLSLSLRARVSVAPLHTGLCQKDTARAFLQNTRASKGEWLARGTATVAETGLWLTPQHRDAP